MSRYAFGSLLVLELDVEADGHAARLLRAAVRRLHHAGAAARDDGEAGLGEQTARLSCDGVHGALLA